MVAGQVAGPWRRQLVVMATRILLVGPGPWRRHRLHYSLFCLTGRDSRVETFVYNFPLTRLIAAAVAAVAVTACQAAPKPHLIFMLTDDLGYSAPVSRELSLQGGSIMPCTCTELH